VGEEEGLESRQKEDLLEIRKLIFVSEAEAAGTASPPQPPSLLRAVRLPLLVIMLGVHAAGTRAPPA